MHYRYNENLLFRLVIAAMYHSYVKLQLRSSYDRIPASSLHMRRKIHDYDAEVRSLALERTTWDQRQLEQPWGGGVGPACVLFRWMKSRR